MNTTTTTAKKKLIGKHFLFWFCFWKCQKIVEKKFCLCVTGICIVVCQLNGSVTIERTDIYPSDLFFSLVYHKCRFRLNYLILFVAKQFWPGIIFIIHYFFCFLIFLLTDLILPIQMQ